MTARSVLFFIVCLFGVLTLMLIHNSFYKQAPLNAAISNIIVAPS